MDYSITYAANSCPDWLVNRSNNIPTCPTNGLVPETFPLGAIVVSDKGYNGRDSGFTADLVEKVLMASSDNNPLFILPVSNQTIIKIKSKINRMPVSEDLKKKFKNSIIQVPTNGYTWQQDYMQPFINPATGKVLLREVQDYARHKNSLDKIIQTVQSCGIQRGTSLSTSKEKAVFKKDWEYLPGVRISNKKEVEYLPGGYGGGNIETLPAEICLLGDDNFGSAQKWETYANQICLPGDENRIKVPTSWLRVGHTDEIMKVIRNKNVKEPCNFSVVLASPQKAIELLKQSPNDKFLDFSTGRGDYPLVLSAKRSVEYQGLLNLCGDVLIDRFRRQFQESNFKPNGGVSKIFNLLFLFKLEAKAGAKVASMSPPFKVDLEDCSKITNEDVYRVLTKTKRLQIFNKMIQEKMDALKSEITQKMKKKLPMCEPDFIDAPDLFFGGMPVEKSKNQYELPKGMGASILPNPTNSITVNDTVISPDPSNGEFKKYLKEQYEKRGLKADFLDTFEYAHMGLGNLHCATNTIHICNPRNNK